MATRYSPKIATDGLVLCLDAANPKSYPGSGTTWFDLSGRNNHITILASAFNSAGRYMDFGGAYGSAKYTTTDFVPGTNTITAVVWTRILNSSTTWRTLFRGLDSSGNHQVIIESGGWNIGMYDNDSSTGFQSTGYSQQSIPGYGTTQWNMLIWKWQPSSPNYQFSYNDTPYITRGQLTTAVAGWGATRGICSIGSYNNGSRDPANGSQYWGDIAYLMLYNRVLSDSELLTIYSATKGRYGLS